MFLVILVRSIGLVVSANVKHCPRLGYEGLMKNERIFLRMQTCDSQGSGSGLLRVCPEISY